MRYATARDRRALDALEELGIAPEISDDRNLNVARRREFRHPYQGRSVSRIAQGHEPRHGDIPVAESVEYREHIIDERKIAGTVGGARQVEGELHGVHFLAEVFPPRSRTYP